ncbi:hypothetical protein [Burkholderia gladioli]|uniref:hypothetical protein n=1 Tax=Burkholderia gladioli TaxID=28095 RepID=UPI00163FC01C|nr:hypothetical protein [Burkholderia gladioli]
MATTVTKEEPMERYRLSGGDNWAWATIALRSWERPTDGGFYYCGEILINSDYGNYAQCWGNMGSPLKKFLVSIGRDYLLDKLAPHSRFEFDFEGSVANVKRDIIESRRSGDLTNGQARYAWNEIPEENQGKDLFVSRLLDIPCLGDEPWHLLESRECPQITGFYTHIWLPFVEALRAELAVVKAAATN